MALQANRLIRMRRDPGRTGVITGKTRKPNYYQVRFPEGLEWKPEGEIEYIEDNSDPFELFGLGKLGGPSDLERVLLHARISGRLSDIFYSMETTNTDFYPFQYKPILKILDSPSNSLLIADEVGLGKTIEAGLIWTELRSRFDYRRLLVVCPAMLREKWRRELQKRFGVEATVVDARGLKNRLSESQQSISTRERGFALIASMQGLRLSKTNIASKKLHDILDKLVYEEPVIDLLIIDEAHYLKNPSSKTHKLGKSLVNISGHRIFLSATPIHLDSDDLFHILNLLDETTFYHNGIFDDILKANSPLVKASDMIKKSLSHTNYEELKGILKEAENHHLLQNNRQLKHLIKELESSDKMPDLEKASDLSYKLNEVNLLANIVTRTRKRDVQENRVIREPIPEKIKMTPVERVAYKAITKLVQEYAKNKPVSEAFLMVMPQKRLSSCMAAAVGHWESLKYNINDLNEEEENSEWDFFESLDGKEYTIGPLNRFLVKNLDKIGVYSQLRIADSKYKLLQKILYKFQTDYPGEKNRPFFIF